MTNVSAVTALGISAVSLFGLWFLYAYAYRRYRIDLFRDRMFALRERLFDYAMDGNISFDDSAYGLLRVTMNGFIRLADRIALLPMMVHVIVAGKAIDQAKSEGFQEKWQRVLPTLPPAVREQMTGFMVEMNVIVLDQVVFTSPTLTLTILPLVVWMFVRHLLGKMVQQFIDSWKGPWIGSIDSAAHLAGTAA